MTDFKDSLFKLNQNLQILQQREAKYGTNAPVDLLNQISDHKEAISLTRQAIIEEISEYEWVEALKPLLLAVSNGQVIHLEAETYIAGDQHLHQTSSAVTIGDVEGGISGAKIAGRDIIEIGQCRWLGSWRL